MILSRIRKKSIHLASILFPLLGAATAIQAADPFVVTASNATANQLLVYSPSGQLLQTLSTKGAGGATGNAGGVQTSNGLVAVVNFGSQSVSIFQVGNNGLSLTQVVPRSPTRSASLSVKTIFTSSGLPKLNRTQSSETL